MELKDMDTIAVARELGRRIQSEEAFIRLQMAREAADHDKELQQAISRFSMIRAQMDEETAKPEEERNNEQFQNLGKEFRTVYAEIMSNPNMISYNEAKDSLDIIIRRISAIIEKSVDGEDPDTADYTASCSGSCATCGGCG